MQVIARSLAAPPVSPCASAGKPCGPHGTVHAHQPAPPCITATVRTATLGQHVPRVDSLESEDENPSSSTNDACEGIKQSRAVKPLGATTSPAAPSGASSTPVSDEATDLAKPPAIANATLVSVESMDGTLEGLEETSPSHPNEVLPHGGINSNPQAIDTAPVAAPTSTTPKYLPAEQRAASHGTSPTVLLVSAMAQCDGASRPPSVQRVPVAWGEPLAEAPRNAVASFLSVSVFAFIIFAVYLVLVFTVKFTNDQARMWVTAVLVSYLADCCLQQVVANNHSCSCPRLAFVT